MANLGEPHTAMCAHAAATAPTDPTPPRTG